jgi:hypothetical protein
LADFLLNYEALLTDIKHSEMTDKDKVSVDIHVLANQNCSSIFSRVEDKHRARWVAPPNGKVTINVDAAYLPATRDAAVGVLGRWLANMMAPSSPLLARLQVSARMQKRHTEGRSWLACGWGTDGFGI